MTMNEVSEMRVRALELAIEYDPTAPAIAICAIAEEFWKFIVGYEKESKRD